MLCGPIGYFFVFDRAYHEIIAHATKMHNISRDINRQRNYVSCCILLHLFKKLNCSYLIIDLLVSQHSNLVIDYTLPHLCFKHNRLGLPGPALGPPGVNQSLRPLAPQQGMPQRPLLAWCLPHPCNPGHRHQIPALSPSLTLPTVILPWLRSRRPRLSTLPSLPPPGVGLIRLGFSTPPHPSSESRHAFFTRPSASVSLCPFVSSRSHGQQLLNNFEPGLCYSSYHACCSILPQAQTAELHYSPGALSLRYHQPISKL